MRSANSFTFGPWHAERTGTKCWQIHNEHSPIADVTGAANRIRYPDVDENAANARLIAAAPDLLASLTDAAIRCAGLHGDKFREHRCVTCSKWLDVIEKAVAP